MSAFVANQIAKFVSSRTLKEAKHSKAPFRLLSIRSTRRRSISVESLCFYFCRLHVGHRNSQGPG